MSLRGPQRLAIEVRHRHYVERQLCWSQDVFEGAITAFGTELKRILNVSRRCERAPGRAAHTQLVLGPIVEG